MKEERYESILNVKERVILNDFIKLNKKNLFS